MHCNKPQHTAAHGNILQHTVSHCITLRHTATFCSTLRHRSNARAIQCHACWGQGSFVQDTRQLLLHKRSLSVSTACADAGGRRFVYMYVYIYKYWLQGTRKGGFIIHAEGKKQRTNTHTQTYTPTCRHTYIILRTLHSPTDRPTNKCLQILQPYSALYLHLQTYNPYIQTYNPYMLTTTICNENVKWDCVCV
jgi:hypothetical protein